MFNYQDTKIVTASGDRTVKIWDAKSGELLHTLKNQGSPKFNRNGDKVLTLSQGLVIAWDSNTGQCLYKLDGDDFSFCDFNNQGDKIITRSTIKHIAQIWNASNGQLICSLSDHTAAINSVMSNKQDDKVLTTSWDKTARIWDISIIKYLENNLSLEQVLLLNLIYETALVSKFNKLRKVDAEKVYFDFEKYPKLKKVYQELIEQSKKDKPELIGQIKRILARYVKNSGVYLFG